MLLLLLKLFKEGSPSAVVGFQGAPHLNTKYNDKPNNLITISIKERKGKKRKKELNYNFY